MNTYWTIVYTTIMALFAVNAFTHPDQAAAWAAAAGMALVAALERVNLAVVEQIAETRQVVIEAMKVSHQIENDFSQTVIEQLMKEAYERKA